MRRFEREARAIAALSHPNVLTVFDAGRRDEQAFLVFELLEGSTLAHVMEQGALRTREALDFAAQVARGLAAVHARGIVHRDIKPANLFLTTARVVKILDFGLARAAAAPTRDPGAAEPTATEAAAGRDDARLAVGVGTVSYMSPEQSQGQPLDARSDIFSFGTVLYEMLSGRHPWKRDSAAGTVASILRDDPPDLGRLDGTAAGPLEPLVRRCLEKRPQDRFQSASDLALALELLQRGEPPSSPAAQRRPARLAATPSARKTRVVVSLATLVLAPLALAWLAGRGAMPPPRVEPLTTTAGAELDPWFSPDGEQVAFRWGGERSDNDDIYIKLVGSPEARRLTSSPLPEWMPRWSPDGQQIAFVRVSPGQGGAIHVVSPLGGGDRKVSDAPAGLGHDWTRDGSALVVGAAFVAARVDASAPDRGIRLVRVADGHLRAITSPAPPTYHAFPVVSFDGRRLAYLACVSFSACHVELAELDSDFGLAGPPRRLTRRPFFPQGAGSLAWTADAKGLLFSAGALTASSDSTRRGGASRSSSNWRGSAWRRWPSRGAARGSPSPGC